jgi:hypothetical protein
MDGAVAHLPWFELSIAALWCGRLMALILPAVSPQRNIRRLVTGAYFTN